MKDENTGKLYGKFKDGSTKELVPMHEIFLPQHEPTPTLKVGDIVLHSEYKDMKFCDGIYKNCIGKITHIEGVKYTLELFGVFHIDKFNTKSGTKDITYNGNNKYEIMEIVSQEYVEKLTNSFLPYNSKQKEALVAYKQAESTNLTEKGQTLDSIRNKYRIILEDGNVAELRDIYVKELYKFMSNSLEVDTAWLRYDKKVDFLTKDGKYLPLILTQY